MLARAPIDGHQMSSNWIIVHAYRHRRRSVAYRHRRSSVVRLQALEKLSLPFQKLCRAESHARVLAIRKQQFIRQLPLQHNAPDVGWTTLPPRRLPPHIHWLNANAGVSGSHQQTSQPPPLAQSSPAAQSSTEQPLTRPLTTQDVPSIVQAVLDTVNTRSTSVAVLGSTEAVPTVIPPAPSPVQADTNEPAQVATTAVVPSPPTTEVVPNLAPSKLPALI